MNTGEIVIDTINFSGLSGGAIEEKAHFNEWRQYLVTNPLATIYHLPEWSDVLENSFGYKSFHILAHNSDGKICGILPLLLVKSALTGNRLVSLPFSYSCGPIADSDEVLINMIEQARVLCHTLKCRYLEIKLMKDNPQLNRNLYRIQGNFGASEQFSTFILELSKPDLVWKKLDPKSVRWAVRKAQKDGVGVRKGSSPQDIASFYQLNLKTKKRIGVPGHPESLFSNMFEKLHDRCVLYLAEFNNKTIAGIITMKFNDTVLYGYAASDDDYRVHQPNSLLVWTAIEEACQEGYRYFDFGRTSPTEQNVTSFKRHWGTEEKILSYYYYPQIPNSMALNDAGLKYKLASTLWRRLPLPMAQFCSNKIFPHLG